jgi:hypothetical protein
MPRDPIPGYPRGNKDPRLDPSEPPPKPVRESMSEKEFAEAVHIQHSGFRAQIPAVVVAALITAIGTYFATVASKHDDTQTQIASCLTKAQFDEAMRVQTEQYNRRFDVIETDTSYLKITVRLVQDKLNAKP